MTHDSNGKRLIPVTHIVGNEASETELLREMAQSPRST